MKSTDRQPKNWEALPLLPLFAADQPRPLAWVTNNYSTHLSADLDTFRHTFTKQIIIIIIIINISFRPMQS